ncbi:MAG TPA: hypothetical protein VFT37_00185 [Telluria sp.]|nr:hypothetical protein [Telluria sp.]
MPIDTQQVVDKLTGAGVPDQQAKAHASVLSEALRTYDAQLAARICTKQDLAAALDPIVATLARLEASIKALDAKIDATAARLNAKIDATAARLDAKIDAAAARLDAKIDASESRLDEKISAAGSKIKGELIGWMISIWAFQSALITALVLKVAS